VCDRGFVQPDDAQPYKDKDVLGSGSRSSVRCTNLRQCVPRPRRDGTSTTRSAGVLEHHEPSVGQGDRDAVKRSTRSSRLSRGASGDASSNRVCHPAPQARMDASSKVSQQSITMSEQSELTAPGSGRPAVPAPLLFLLVRGGCHVAHHLVGFTAQPADLSSWKFVGLDNYIDLYRRRGPPAVDPNGGGV